MQLLCLWKISPNIFNGTLYEISEILLILLFLLLPTSDQIIIIYDPESGIKNKWDFFFHLASKCILVVFFVCKD